jgi:hypothetical protein
VCHKTRTHMCTSFPQQHFLKLLAVTAPTRTLHEIGFHHLSARPLLHTPCMYAQVETTLSKAVLRVVGTAVGSLIGWGLMYHPSSANNPYLVSV